ncbi:MAG TPA: ABC transporter ATP-binding protein [Methylomusa anaerophila]|uniref:Putative siderophore transport system ATP-binding protein YusV n=1 Tax=Methylomusa anaerophila TaxID=1930071 RepID=A0A348ALE5_9FIRM|nr:ABC transporter ATP-binding protein [Methylomusa anaerophila]BBB91893.1 putative siderophore transport system ATP-binding protein YusV [Methylomusa anaerophila]HML88376.1 ABC transporter ATP-binding protein [Methylomusa anaerophila]
MTANKAFPVLRAESLTAGYNGKPIVSDIDFTVDHGEFLSIVAPNGTGKTTLIRTLAGVLPPLHGAVSVCGRNVAGYSRRDLAKLVAVVGQNESVADYTVEQVVAMGRYSHIPRFGSRTHQDESIINRVLAQVGMKEKRKIFAGQLSQGERQKVTVARALAQCPKLLILDEPTSHLDVKNQIEILRLIKRMTAEQGLTTLAVLHDINLASHFSTHLAFLKDGRMTSYGRTQEVLSVETLQNLYGMNFTLLKDAGSIFVQPDYGLGDYNQ